MYFPPHKKGRGGGVCVYVCLRTCQCIVSEQLCQVWNLELSHSLSKASFPARYSKTKKQMREGQKGGVSSREVWKTKNVMCGGAADARPVASDNHPSL